MVDIDALALLRKINGLSKDLSNKGEKVQTIEEIFTDKTILQRRHWLKSECEKLAEFPHFRREALEILWKHCIYEPICCYKSFTNLDEDDQAMLKKFISKSINEITNLLSQFTDVRFLLIVNLGDLYRYCYELCGKDQRDFDIAEQCYLKAILSDSHNGRPFNQLGLMVRERSATEALFYFLRSSIQSADATQSLRNIKLMDESQFTKEECSQLYSLIISFFEFNRLMFENSRKEFDKMFDGYKNAMMKMKFVQVCSMAAIYAFRNEATDEQFRYIASFLCQKLSLLLDESRKCINDEDDLEMDAKRRNKNLSDSEEEEENDEDEERLSIDPSPSTSAHIQQRSTIWMSTIVAAEFLQNCGEYFMTKKLSVSIKLQFQSLLRSFVDLLNELLNQLRPLMESNEMIAKTDLLNWLVGKYEQSDEHSMTKILAHFAKNITAERKLGIIYEEYFKLNNASVEKERQIVENISKLHSTHVNQMNERTRKIPVYISPDQFCFLNRLSLVKKLITNPSQTMTIIVARSVLAKIDKVKRENPNAREAIRWIQSSIQTGHVRMLQESGKNFIGECLNFLGDKKLLDKQTLFMTILTTEEGQKDYKEDQQSEYSALSIEEIGNFIGRISSASDEMERPTK